MARRVCICMFDVAVCLRGPLVNHTLPVLADLWKKNYNVFGKKRTRRQLVLIRQVGADVYKT